jgi:hypothetical protein
VVRRKRVADIEPLPIVPEDETDGERNRDYVMARISGSRNALAAAIESLDEVTALFMNPDDDANGKDRKDALDAAVEELGVATRALEAAEKFMSNVDFEAGEPWDEDDDD